VREGERERAETAREKERERESRERERNTSIVKTNNKTVINRLHECAVHVN
jgi:hypothetical protein